MAYNVKVWQKGDRLTATQLNRIEQGITNATYDVSDLNEIFDESSPIKIIKAGLVPNFDHTQYILHDLSWTVNEIEDFINDGCNKNIVLITNNGVEWPGQKYFYISGWIQENNKNIFEFNDGYLFNIQIILENEELSTNVFLRSVYFSQSTELDNGKILQIDNESVKIKWNNISWNPNTYTLLGLSESTPGTYIPFFNNPNDVKIIMTDVFSKNKRPKILLPELPGYLPRLIPEDSITLELVGMKQERYNNEKFQQAFFRQSYLTMDRKYIIDITLTLDLRGLNNTSNSICCIKVFDFSRENNGSVSVYEP